MFGVFVLACCRGEVRAGLSSGTAHSGVPDRGRHIRHDKNGVATVPSDRVHAVQQDFGIAGHAHPRGHRVVRGHAHRVSGAHRVPGRLVCAGKLLDTIRVLAGLGTVVAVRTERLVQPDAVHHQFRAPGVRVRGRRLSNPARGGHTDLPADVLRIEIAYGRHRSVRLHARPPRQPPDDHHRYTSVQRHTHQRHPAGR